MAINIAAKRGKKAQRRKQMLAERHRQEAFDNSLPERVRRAAELPIQHCLLTEALFEGGTGTLILARGTTTYNMTLAGFLIDTLALGVKDVMLKSVGADAFATYVEAMEAAAPIAPVDPAYARKLVRDVTQWSRSHGFPPHRDFAAVERIFGDVSADACDVDFGFDNRGGTIITQLPPDARP